MKNKFSLVQLLKNVIKMIVKLNIVVTSVVLYTAHSAYTKLNQLYNMSQVNKFILSIVN